MVVDANLAYRAQARISLGVNLKTIKKGVLKKGVLYRRKDLAAEGILTE